MASRGSAEPDRRRSIGGGTTPITPAFDLDESKLEPPRPREGIVARSALLDRLNASPGRPVIGVVAAAGYGKTTLLAQWLAQHARGCWITVDDGDNDPAVLLSYLVAALSRVAPIPPISSQAIVAQDPGIADFSSLIATMSAMTEPVVLVIDNAESITGTASRDMIAELVVRLPPGSCLAIGSRAEVPVPVARLRAEGRIVEVGADDLAMGDVEARSVLAGAGVDVDDVHVHRLVERTEGWPTGLYLAALAMRAARSQSEAEATVTGDDRFVGDYLRTVLLSRVSRQELVFLTRTSILERMSASLCDATVRRTGSSHVLDRLERRNLLVVPLDRRGDWYRYHHMFRELLYSELVAREPQMLPELHLRAAGWYESNGLPEAAVDHAQQAGDGPTVERLVLKLANPLWASGRLDTVLRWMEWFSTDVRIEQHPAIAVHGGLIYALIGRAGEAERWARAAERSTATGPPPDGNTMEGTLAYLRALLCRRGLDQMRRDAQEALDGLSPLSPYRPAMMHAQGAAALLQGDADRADRYFLLAQDEASSASMEPFVALLLAERGLVAVDRHDWDRAESLARQAMLMIEDRQFRDYWTSALVYAYGARVLAHQGDAVAARELVARAGRLRTLLTYALPIVSGQALHELAQACVSLGDTGGAHAALRQIHDIEQHRPSLGLLTTRAHELRSRLSTMQGEMLGVSSLSTAELRVLALLPSHLTLAEIGERLSVSRNTVKAHATAIYRKLSVSSRAEVVDRLDELNRPG